ncbi:WcaI family glycosyltransferase [Terrimonas sp. NA20]|uniref:WcaI family glycosyltransferase n=1 Tax=Terrimonas ginsenosidimutans TaxID=2908004 RepID=A0ABS9L0F3_9BACT|nr:WcaI family glycosyltransferase [Terrimonas ginsenosidimutans]
MKNILLIAGNYHPELTGIGRYNGEMLEWLSNQGYDCTTIATYPYYPQWKIAPAYKKKHRWYSSEKNGNIRIYRCPHYIPARPGGIKRMILDFSFFVSGFFKTLQLVFGKKRDIIIVVSPPLVPTLLGLTYKFFRGGKMIFHVQDLQIEAARDLQMIKSRSLIRMLFGLERFIMKRASVQSSISTGMVNKVKAKSGRDVILFPNWSDTTRFFPLEKQGLKTDFGFAETDTVVLYSGAIGEKQGLEIILTAAGFFRENTSLKFIICGSGPYKEKLKQQALNAGITNVHFLDLQPAEQLNRFLNMADMHLVIQKADASDLVMPSKLTNILAVGGLAIVTANPGNSLYDEINDHQMGIIATAESAESLAEAIKIGMTDRISQYKANARRYAEDFLSIDKVMQRFVTSAIEK